jgi:PKD repeat protein
MNKLISEVMIALLCMSMLTCVLGLGPGKTDGDGHVTIETENVVFSVNETIIACYGNQTLTKFLGFADERLGRIMNITSWSSERSSGHKLVVQVDPIVGKAEGGIASLGDVDFLLGTGWNLTADHDSDDISQPLYGLLHEMIHAINPSAIFCRRWLSEGYSCFLSREVEVIFGDISREDADSIYNYSWVLFVSNGYVDFDQNLPIQDDYGYYITAWMFNNLTKEYGWEIHEKFFKYYDENRRAFELLLSKWGDPVAANCSDGCGYVIDTLFLHYYSLAADEPLYDRFNRWGVTKLVPINTMFPTASFASSQDSPYIYQTVTFDASMSFVQYPSIMNYTWDFDDGNITTTTSSMIDHSYSIADAYDVTLTVTNELGLKNSTTKSLAVLEDNIPPVTTSDYDGQWHNADFSVTLTATDSGSGIREIYYRINRGPVFSVLGNGQPIIGADITNGTLEYWSVDKAGNEELPHKDLSGIRLDKTRPVFCTQPSQIPVNQVQPDQAVSVLANITDNTSGVKNATLSYCLNDTDIWISLPMTINSSTNAYEATIQGLQGSTVVRYRIVAFDNAGNVAVEDNNGLYYVYAVIPEFSPSIVLPLLLFPTTLAMIFIKKSGVSKTTRAPYNIRKREPC